VTKHEIYQKKQERFKSCGILSYAGWAHEWMLEYRPRITGMLSNLRVSHTLTKVIAYIRHPRSRKKRRVLRNQLTERLEIRGFLSHEELPFAWGAPSVVRPPAITVIVPNFNHARFLRERLRSILEQTRPADEIIILDDASSDGSLELIEEITRDANRPVRLLRNDINSGSIFSQWEKGLALASGDLIWICESDDSCDENFLQTLIPHFQDPSVMLAFGRIDFIDEAGAPRHDANDRIGLEQFSDSARLASASSWFNGPFGLRCVIRNVGGCVFRRQTIDEGLIAELKTYKICGDWLLYSRLARGGQIAYEPRARSYFRIHGANSSVASFRTTAFYDEHVRIAYALRRHYGVKIKTLSEMLRKTWHQCKSTLGKRHAAEFASRLSLPAIAAEPRVVQHILIAIDPASRDNGGPFPFLFAKELLRQGHDVSLLVIGSETVPEEFQSLLAKEIPIFRNAHVDRSGLNDFIREFGITLINTHHASVDEYLYRLSARIGVSYIATDHRSYRNRQIDKKLGNWLCRNVDKWVSSQSENGVPDAIAQEFARTRRGARRFWHAKLSAKKGANLVNSYVAAQRTLFSSL
jgi:glycosyltransferase involved in cell wall biosynthesis